MSEKPAQKILRALRNLLLVLGISAGILFLPVSSLKWLQAWLLLPSWVYFSCSITIGGCLKTRSNSRNGATF